MPDFLKDLEKNYGGNAEDFSMFKNAFLRTKKNLELDIIHQNKKQEVINEIVSLTDQDRNLQREKYKKIHRQARKVIALEKQKEI